MSVALAPTRNALDADATFVEHTQRKVVIGYTIALFALSAPLTSSPPRCNPA